MATITLKGNPVLTAGELPPVGRKAPSFKLCTADMRDVGLDEFKGKCKIMNIVASLDTSVCAQSARRFNEAAAAFKNTVVLNISADLPYAQKRLCDSQALANIVTLSTMRSPSFGRVYGVGITSGPMAGLMSRAVIVLNAADKVVYTQQVPEIAQEPDYDRAIEAARKAEA
jgi:thioredoxin-dependent peroxiredoxin